VLWSKAEPAEPITSRSEVSPARDPRFSAEVRPVEGNVIAAGAPPRAAPATEGAVEGSSKPTPAAMTENTTRVPADRVAKQIPIADANPPLVKMLFLMPMPSLVFYTPPLLLALRICTATLRSYLSLQE
jgi:hypothetical protein